jgi:hypothetical protein
VFGSLPSGSERDHEIGVNETGTPVMKAWFESGSKLSGPAGSSALAFTPGVRCATRMPGVR